MARGVDLYKGLILLLRSTVKPEYVHPSWFKHQMLSKVLEDR